MITSPLIAVVGLGYVGLPLAIEFGKKYSVIGFDISAGKIRDLLAHVDQNREIEREQFELSKGLTFTSDSTELAQADVIVVSVPTPVDEARAPDFAPLLSACDIVGRQMKRGCTVVFESTVYPGATEEVCIPALERASQHKWRTDFSVGYSPERVNPGDKDRTISKIVKVVSGDSSETLDRLSNLYGSIIKAGVYQASSIAVAEAAKVIENIQRDINIALVNELAVIFNRLGIDTAEVLQAAASKWNFLPFKPGLVGGHCIGVDPYYLTYKAQMVGYHPEVILAGRRINDSMSQYVAQQTIKVMISAGLTIKNSIVVVLGVTFKENCADTRNSKVVDLIRELKDYGCEVLAHDPVALNSANNKFEMNLSEWREIPKCDAMILAVPHNVLVDEGIEHLLSPLKPGGVFVDLKSVFPVRLHEGRNLSVMRL